MALESALLAGDPKLEAAAEKDSAHIVPGDRGDHVKTIQQALNDVAGAALVADGIYGPATAAAVADFKRNHRPPILNYAGQIDNIVGKKTLAALDARLPKPGRGGLNLNFIIGITTVDIVVSFVGAAGRGFDDPEKAIPKGMLSGTYTFIDKTSKTDRWRSQLNENILLRIAYRTNGFGIGFKQQLLDVIQEILDELKKPDPASGNILVPGKVYLHGTSSGAHNAIDFLQVMIPLLPNAKPRFVIPIDAPFFQKDTLDRPFSTKEPVSPIPRFNLNSPGSPFLRLIDFERRIHFFQRRGNHAKRIFNPFSDFFSLVYTSDMAGGLEEIHGHINGFDNREVGPGQFGNGDDGFHEFCDAEGRRQAQLLEVADLTLLR